MLIVGSNYWLKWHVHMPFSLIDAFCWLHGALRCCLLAAAAFSAATGSFVFLGLKYDGPGLLQLRILQQAGRVTACQIFVLILDEMYLSQLHSSYTGSAWVQPQLAPRPASVGVQEIGGQASVLQLCCLEIYEQFINVFYRQLLVCAEQYSFCQGKPVTGL